MPVESYTGDAVNLPRPDEIPNVDLEVMNYHRPIIGTFHAKYMVVDRRVAILQRSVCPNMEIFALLKPVPAATIFKIA